MSFIQWLEGWIWRVIGKLPNPHDKWNSVEEHPYDEVKRH